MHSATHIPRPEAITIGMLLGIEPLPEIHRPYVPKPHEQADIPKETFADYQRKKIAARRERIVKILAASEAPMLRKQIAEIVGACVDTVRFDLLALAEERRVKSMRVANWDLWSVCHVGT